MWQGNRALVLLGGSALIACILAAQEARPTPADGRAFRIYHIYLAGTTDSPISIKASVEHIESIHGTKVVSKHWAEEWTRDQEGRVWGRVRAPQEDHPRELPPLATVWLFDPAKRKRTICSVANRECRVDEYDPPSTIAFLAVGGSSSVGIEPVFQVPAQRERVQCGDERFGQTFLGEYSIGGISLGHIRMMCYKPDGSGSGVDVWHNSEFNIDFDVTHGPLKEGETYYLINQISPFVPDKPELFQVPPDGYSVR